ncbi:MAG: NCS2 family permease [Tissierellia bacterium]|nr:NCS2 family permease [Tissierellia bacterium]
MEKFFKLKENKTSVKTEILAGITTFMTMAYILAVNPLFLGKAGMDPQGVFIATALSAAISTIFMGLYARYPFALAPGMGLNAYFAYVVVLKYNFTWQQALALIFLEGIIFIILSFVKVRELIFNSIPRDLKNAVSVGIGLFIALIGLNNSGIVTNGEGTILTLGKITQNTSLLAIIGIILTGILVAKNVRGAILIGIVLTTVIGIPMEVTNVENIKLFQLPTGLSNVAFKLDFPSNIFNGPFFIALFTFLFVDMFDTVGTLAGVASKTDMLDKDGKLPRVERALLSDAIGTTIGALLGTSTVTTYVESSAGVAEGGRTGLTAITTGILFILAVFFAPLFAIVPASATAPALVIVGLFMMSPVKNIEWDDFTVAIPSFLTIIMMPFAFSIAEGIVFGMISYTILKLGTGKFKDVSPLVLVLSLIFLVRYIFLPL